MRLPFALAAAALAVAGCDGFYSVRGAVRDPQGNPVPDAQVYTGESSHMDAVLRRPDAYADARRRLWTGAWEDWNVLEMPKGFSDSTGHYDAGSTCGGAFDVWMVVLKPGYAPYHARAPVDWEHGAVGLVDVVLQPSEGTGATVAP